MVSTKIVQHRFSELIHIDMTNWPQHLFTCTTTQLQGIIILNCSSLQPVVCYIFLYFDLQIVYIFQAHSYMRKQDIKVENDVVADRKLRNISSKYTLTQHSMQISLNNL